MSETDIESVKKQWVGTEFEVATFTVETDQLLAWAAACGETDPRFIDPEHPDFQAHPTFTTHLMAKRTFPPDFPDIGTSGMDGGKAIEMLGPIRPGDRLTATATIADVYTKTGRSGTMIFIVQRMSFVNQNDLPVATVDWRMIRSG